jgi:hypothetical protein
MRARQLIDGVALGPDALKAIGKAFDAAWGEIAHRFDSSLAIEATRLELANALLSIANEDSRDAQVLKQAVLKRLAFDAQWIRSGLGGPGRIEGDQLGVGVGPTPTEGNVVPPEPG